MVEPPSISPFLPFPALFPRPLSPCKLLSQSKCDKSPVAISDILYK